MFLKYFLILKLYLSLYESQSSHNVRLWARDCVSTLIVLSFCFQHGGSHTEVEKTYKCRRTFS